MADDFTGSNIDLVKWTKVDPSGTNVTQNNYLIVKNSLGGAWGATSLSTASTYPRSNNTSFTIDVTTNSSDTLIGYGDTNFAGSGKNAYLLDITAHSGGGIVAFIWQNGSPIASPVCAGGAADGTYKMTLTATGYQIYRGGSLLCSVDGLASLDNQHFFVEANYAASGAYFDNAIVSDSVVGPSSLKAISSFT
ncbi:MAG: hypothetical protein ACR2IQ_00825, partial [Minisyncoccia bacterium]